MRTLRFAPVLLSTVCAFSTSFSSPRAGSIGGIIHRRNGWKNAEGRLSVVAASSTKDDDDDVMIRNVFEFSGDASSKSVSSFERIDDAIMGGISLSALKDVENEPYASWSGICRTDGGGFCGMRTLPFKEPLDVEGVDGIVMECRLASDDEPERRVWKMTLRSDTSRGEQVYQAAFPLPKSDADDQNQWNIVKVPFDQFQLVRGPRLVPNGPKFNTTAGVYQIGVSLSKFIIGENTTQLENFRPGFFELQFKRIGFYTQLTPKATDTTTTTIIPDTLTKEEVLKKRPLLLKLLFPIAKVFFSEKANRRKSAMNILTQKRGMNRWQAMIFGIRSRSSSKLGIIPSIFKTLSIVSIDSFRFLVRTLLRIVFIYPIRILRKTVSKTKQLFTKTT